tara:strand:- start:214 stop:648 length:435 start_codon:yes stop_codon:yes gene_type:complete
MDGIKSMPKTEMYRVEDMIRLVHECKGFTTKAIEKGPWSASTFYRYMHEYPELKAAIQEAAFQTGDEVEFALYDEAVRNRNISALIFLAKTKYRHLGYIEKRDIGLEISPEIIQLAKQLGINQSEIVKEFEELIRAEANRAKEE